LRFNLPQPDVSLNRAAPHTQRKNEGNSTIGNNEAELRIFRLRMIMNPLGSGGPR
jgi:hypothetical protein